MTAEYIKEAYDKLKKKLGKQPSLDEFYENTTVTSHYLLKGGFRTYSQLVEEMGDTPKTFFHGGKSEDDFLISYGNMVRKLNRIPSSQDWLFNNGLPTTGNYKRKFAVNNWGQIVFKFFDYAKDRVEWEDIIDLIPEAENKAITIQQKDNEECYVYLMLDRKNGYYKIGISNEPEWREKTLQSEKPSIKLIAAKKFVNRRIAANFEKALHDSYSHKRKRGEWFQFDQEDIDEIRITLT
jgi:hypothetical protein